VLAEPRSPELNPAGVADSPADVVAASWAVAQAAAGLDLEDDVELSTCANRSPRGAERSAHRRPNAHAL
jgi:hypothetical protein